MMSSTVRAGDSTQPVQSASPTVRNRTRARTAQLPASGLEVLVDRHQHAVPHEDRALVGEVDGGHLDLLVGDVLPDIELRPIGQRKDPDVLALVVTPVEQVPRARDAGSSGPTARTGHGSCRSAPWRGPSPRRDGRLRRARRTRSRGSFAAAWASAACCGSLEDPPRRRSARRQCRPALCRPRAEGPCLSTVRSRKSRTSGKLRPVSMCSTGKGRRGREERLARQMQHDDGVLAAREQQSGPLELGCDFADDVDRLGLQRAADG